MTSRNCLQVELALKILAVKFSPSKRLTFYGFIRTKQENEPVS